MLNHELAEVVFLLKVHNILISTSPLPCKSCLKKFPLFSSLLTKSVQIPAKLFKLKSMPRYCSSNSLATEKLFRPSKSLKCAPRIGSFNRGSMKMIWLLRQIKFSIIHISYSFLVSIKEFLDCPLPTSHELKIEFGKPR